MIMESTSTLDKALIYLRIAFIHRIAQCYLLPASCFLLPGDGMGRDGMGFRHIFFLTP